VTIKLYVEGGGSSKSLRTACRQGFSELLKKAGLVGRMPRIIACGGRQDAYDSFCTCLGTSASSEAVLLVDAEGPVGSADSWDHLRAHDGWDRPKAALDEQCHLMVQCMEAWFLADREKVTGFFGQGFHEGALPAAPRVEEIPKGDVLSGLERATRGTLKGSYRKTAHSFWLLAKIDASQLEHVAPHAARFFEALRALAARV
jgi:Domain of unknown function (DUF4276)